MADEEKDEEKVEKLLLVDLDELNEKIGNNVYVMIADGRFVSSTRKAEINKVLLAHSPEISRLTDTGAVVDALEDAQLIYGVLLDPFELPENLPQPGGQECSIWVLTFDAYMSEITLEEYLSMEDAIEAIERHIMFFDGVDFKDEIMFENVAIIAGYEMEFVLQVGDNRFTGDAGEMRRYITEC